MHFHLANCKLKTIIEVSFVKISVSCCLVVTKGVEICPLSLSLFGEMSTNLNMFGVILLDWVLCYIDFAILLS